MIWMSTKPCITHVERINAYMNKYAHKYAYICIYDSLINGKFGSLFKSKSHYDRQSVGQSILVSGAHLGPATNFSFSLRFSFRQLLFVTLYRPLWIEDGSVIYCCCWSSPAQGVYYSQSQSQSYITTDSQSVSMSWCLAQSGTFDQRAFFFVESYCLVIWGAPSLTRGRVCHLSVCCQYSIKLSVGSYIGNLQWYLQYLC
jgi:hypothetical protein